MRDDYIEVAERLVQFFQQHPEGSLRPLDPTRPYWFEDVDGQRFVVYAAAAFRTPDDPSPGVGMAWELVPGKTNFTRTSELMNAETSAWGRALVALGVAANRGIASKQEVLAARSRQGEREPEVKPARKRRTPPAPPGPEADEIATPPDFADPDLVDAVRSEAGALPEPQRHALREFLKAKKLPSLRQTTNYPRVMLEVVEAELARLQAEADG
jgi:hypothetical protein